MEVVANGKKWAIINAVCRGEKLDKIPGRDRMPLAKAIGKIDRNQIMTSFFGGVVRIGFGAYRQYQFAPAS